MRITITTGGSRGDVQPYVALGLGLKEAGHEVLLAAPAAFEGLVRNRGLGFRRISLDPLEGVRRQLEKGDANFLEFAWRTRGILAPVLESDLQAYLEACKGADAVIYTSIGFLGLRVAGELGVPGVGAMCGPLVNSTHHFPSSFLPVPSGRLEVSPGKGSLRGAYNRLSYLLLHQLLWQPLRAPTNGALREAGLSPFPFRGPFEEVRRSRGPVLNGWSRHVLPQPSDWGERLPTTGYWFLDRPEDWRPSRGLEDFLESGPPPVSVGFGSMAGAGAEWLTEIVLGALRRAKQRGVLLTGWGGIGNADLPDEVFMADEVPHDWLFARVAAAVHHGGAGTTAASLRAGIPTVVVPFFADQSFWGARVAGLEVGPRPIPRSKLSVVRLAAAIQQATTDASKRERARLLGQRIQSENGVEKAVNALHRLLEKTG